jgi:hypothetical protein
MMRRGGWSLCAAASSERISSAKPKEPSDTKKPAAPVPTPVLHTLYRALFKEAKRMDKDPLLRVLFPVPSPMQPLVNMDHALLVPGHESYTSALRRCFRDAALRDTPITAAFDILNRARYHNNEVPPRLAESAKQRELFAASLRAAAPPGGLFHATLSSRSSASSVSSKKSLPSYRVENLHQAPFKLIPLRSEATRRNPVALTPGTGLIAHPLSSSHGDRRVMLITEQTPMTTTALVLDMVYAYPMSGGNPMFPEVFWGHEVHNGGFLHVDFTMPPTAHVAVLHTFAPPAPPLLEKIQRDHGSTYHHAWTKWMRLQGSKIAGGTIPTPSVVEHHELLCKPLIRGATRADGTTEPTLYYSKVEALPYLAHLAAGQPRSSMRIYWGCMQWPTTQINNEIANGHWMPVNLSPNFFSGYPLIPSRVRSPPSTASQAEGEAEDAAHGVPMEDRFPTFEELTAAKSLRMKHFDIDVVAPQVFPPDQPMCKREPLWDQILLSLGGEFEHLIGAANPFSKKSGPSRYPPSEIIAPEDLPDLAHLPLLLSSDDDDDDDE